MRRIFIGIPATQEVQKKAEEFGKQLPLHPLFGQRGGRGEFVRFIKPRNLHITLVPPFGLAQGLRPIIEKLKTASVEPFKICFNQIEFGPNANRPNLIWAKAAAISSILDLRARLYGVLGQKPEHRPFRLHMTIARVAPQYKSLPMGQRGWLINWPMPVDRFVLYESHLLSSGAEYEVLAEFPFASLY